MEKMHPITEGADGEIERQRVKVNTDNKMNRRVIVRNGERLHKTYLKQIEMKIRMSSQLVHLNESNIRSETSLDSYWAVKESHKGTQGKNNH